MRASGLLTFSRHDRAWGSCELVPTSRTSSRSTTSSESAGGLQHGCSSNGTHEPVRVILTAAGVLANHRRAQPRRDVLQTGPGTSILALPSRCLRNLPPPRGLKLNQQALRLSHGTSGTRTRHAMQRISPIPSSYYGPEPARPVAASIPMAVLS